MTSTVSKLALASLAVVSMLGCGGGSPSSVITGYPTAPLATKTDVSKLAGQSAPSVFVASVAIASLAENDAGCPALADDGTTQTFTGNGCTDKDGRTWSGTAKYVKAGNGGTYTYSGFSYSGTNTCADGGSGTGSLTLDGTVTLSQVPTTTGTTTFSTDLKATTTGYSSSACASRDDVIGWSYSGTGVTVNNSAGTGTSTTWNGSGKYGSKIDGQITMSTKDEVVDSTVCNSEAASGTTTITSGSNTAVITYDGATKCDPDSTVKVSINGADQGELSGVTCASASGLAWALALLVLALRRRAA